MTFYKINKMKKILLIAFMCSSYYMNAQTNCTIDASTYVNANITTNGVKSITGLKLNTALNKIISGINCNDSISRNRVDSVKIINDSL